MFEWEELRTLLKDRMDATELVELLELSTDDIVDAFKDEIQDKLPIILEELGIESDTELEE